MSSQPNLIRKLSAVIQSEFPGFELTVFHSGVKGLNQLYQCPPAVIIIDSTLSDISGLQLCRVLKHDPAIQKLPILFITKQTSREYQRLSELSVVADAFIEEKKLDREFPTILATLINLFHGIDESERQQLALLQQDSVQVQATNRMVQLFDESITEVALMKGFRKLFELIPNKNVLHHMLFSLIENVLDYDVAGVFFNDKNRESRLMTYHIPNAIKVRDDQLQALTTRAFDDLKANAPEPWLFSDVRYETLRPEQYEPEKNANLKYTTVFPFFVENTLTGALVFFNRKEVNYPMIFPFSLVLQEFSALMRLRHYYSEAEMLSICDAFTGLYTHQHFMWALDREVRQAKRHHLPVTLAMISVEGFRELNLKWGHDMGDKVIQNLASHALQTLRTTDLLARGGGRKIMALLPNTQPELALIALERIRESVLASPFPGEEETIPFQISIGVAGLGDSVHSATEFIEHVQKALDQARQKGHNGVELFT